MKEIQLILVTIASLLLTACEMEIEVKLFCSDLLEAKGRIDADAKLYFEIPSADWLDKDENKPKLTRFLTQHFGELGNFSTKSLEMKTFCIIPFKTTLTSESNKSDIFALSCASTGAEVQVFCEINADQFKSFRDSLSEEFMASIKLEDIKFRILLDNDTKEALQVTGYSVFLGNTPAAFEGAITLERRAEMIVQVSSIHLDTILYGGKSRVLMIERK